MEEGVSTQKKEESWLWKHVERSQKSQISKCGCKW